MKYLTIILLLAITSCVDGAHPFHYAEWVKVTGGFYGGQQGQIIGICRYPYHFRVQVDSDTQACIHQKNLRLMEITDGNG